MEDKDFSWFLKFGLYFRHCAIHVGNELKTKRVCCRCLMTLMFCENCQFAVRKMSLKKKKGYNENKNINWKSWWTFVRRKDDALQPVKILVRDETSKVETRKPQRWFGPSFNCHHQKGIPPTKSFGKKEKRKRNNIVHRGYIYTVHTVYKYIYILKVKLRWPLFLLSLLPPLPDRQPTCWQEAFSRVSFLYIFL